MERDAGCLGIPGAADMLKLLKLVNYEDDISPLAELFDVYGLGASKLTPCSHPWAVFNCIYRLHSAVGYVWSQCVLRKTLLSSRLNDYIFFLHQEHKHQQTSLADVVIKFPPLPAPAVYKHHTSASYNVGVLNCH